MNQSSETSRPAAITFICTVAFVWATLTVPLIFYSTTKAVGPWYPPYLAFSVAASYLGTGGIWLLRKWGLYVYAGFHLINQIVLISAGMWTLFSILVPAIVIGVAYTHLKLMK
ncbi:hypothetical protein [Emticicia sp. TH156]|uniref:hypothetical protein n=1 Tax=Emticicia sp. TH156 TaxID=2067454 RepID=UPI000C773FB2|nr:hypothetical protein [Emticicia sp. TH156]PLK45361.1 hypothetical protein C0V77_04245 [Emticicia sp. TH156]